MFKARMKLLNISFGLFVFILTVAAHDVHGYYGGYWGPWGNVGPADDEYYGPWGNGYHANDGIYDNFGAQKILYDFYEYLREKLEEVDREAISRPTHEAHEVPQSAEITSAINTSPNPSTESPTPEIIASSPSDTTTTVQEATTPAVTSTEVLTNATGGSGFESPSSSSEENSTRQSEIVPVARARLSRSKPKHFRSKDSHGKFQKMSSRGKSKKYTRGKSQWIFKNSRFKSQENKFRSKSQKAHTNRSRSKYQNLNSGHGNKKANYRYRSKPDKGHAEDVANVYK